MAFKRNIDRLPIIPADATVHNVVCQFCIVGCGYHAYSWPVNKQGGTAPDQNIFGVDLSQQQEAGTAAWYAPSMYNIVKQDGRDVHLVVKPDPDCEVNSGLGSVRGARMAEMSFSEARSTQPQRLTDPMVWRQGMKVPTSWEDALDLVARVTVAVIQEQGEDGLFVSAFDHGGAGGGYENTWGTGKLYFEAMKIKNIRIHNRPAYNSEVHATRDMGVGELNNCYEDAELADTIMAVGTNALETQTNYFLNHWIPNLDRPIHGQEAGAAARRAACRRAHRHRRPAPHRDRQRLRGRGRRGERAAPRDQLRHRPRALQRDVHLRRRPGLARPGLHRRLDQRLRRGAGRQPHLARGRRRQSAASAPRTSSRPPPGSPSRRRAERGGAPCSPTRRV